MNVIEGAVHLHKQAKENGLPHSFDRCLDMALREAGLHKLAWQTSLTGETQYEGQGLYVRVEEIGGGQIGFVKDGEGRVVLYDLCQVETELEIVGGVVTRGVLDTEEAVMDVMFEYRKPKKCILFVSFDVLVALNGMEGEAFVLECDSDLRRPAILAVVMGR